MELDIKDFKDGEAKFQNWYGKPIIIRRFSKKEYDDLEFNHPLQRKNTVNIY